MMPLLADFIPWIVGILAAAGAALSVFWSAKKAGKSEGEKVAAEQREKDRDILAADELRKSKAADEKAMGAIENANDAKGEVNRLDDSAAIDELRRDYTRD